MPATIFSGTKVKALKDTISLNSGADVISSTVDPTSVATSANPGSLLLNTTNGNLYRKIDSGSSTNWALMSSGGDAGINYITNGSAEANTTGWSGYADAAGTRPVDGTGGSPTVTFTRSTSSPLRGIASFLLTKDAANRQGEGASYPFTINAADKAMVMEVSFDYMVSSGTFVAGTSTTDSDVIVYLYDVTNSQLIEPSVFKLFSNSSTTPSKFVGHFQTNSNSTSYRLIFHVASTSASAYVLQMDNIKVGPQAIAYGSIETPWTSFSPVAGANGGGFSLGNGSTSGYWRRVGDSMEMVARLVKGSTTNLGSGGIYITMPSPYLYDTSKIIADANSHVAGVAIVTDGGGSVWTTDACYNGTGTFIMRGGNNNSGNFSATFPTSWSTSTIFEWKVTVPVLGWGAQGIIGQDAETRIVAAKASGDPASASSGNPIIFPTSSYDTHASYSVSTGRYTAPVAGFYRIHGYINSANTGVKLTIYKDGASDTDVGSTDSNGECSYTGTVQANAGQLLDVRPNNTLDAATGSTIHFERMSGPAAVAVSETVFARYSRNTALSLASSTSFTVHDYATKESDTHGAVTTGASWKFTAPIKGIYEVDAVFKFGSLNWDLNEVGTIAVYKNGSIHSELDQFRAEVTATISSINLKGTTKLELVAGDYVDLRVRQNTGGSDTSTPGASEHWITVQKVG